MNLKIASATLAMALITAAVPAAAGDFDYGGSVKDYGAAGVPVPAPVPLPMYEAEWYMRFDAGYAFGQSGDVEVTGFPLNHNDLDDISGTASFSAGFGRYLTPSLRWDITVDIRNSRNVTDHDAAVQTTTTHEGPMVTVTWDEIVAGQVVQRSAQLVSVDTRNYEGDFSQRGSVKSDTVLFNMYYDLDTGTRFKPYIGAGVGVAQHYLKSTARGSLQCVDVTRTALYNPIAQEGPYYFYGLDCPDEAEPIQQASTTSATAYGFAGSLMAGVSAEVHPGILLDVGYRMTYMAGTVALTAKTPLGDSVIDIGDRMEHEFRTGLRFDIN